MIDSFKKFLAPFALMLMVTTVGCANLKPGGDVENYDISVCVPTEDAEVCGKVGQIPLPVGSQPITTLVAIVVTPYLQDALNLKACKFEPALDAVISAVCQLNGKPVRIKLAPEA